MRQLLNLGTLELVLHCREKLLLLLLQVASVVSDSVRPQRWQPTRLPCPWDSPGKNIGVGCYSLLQCMKVKSESEVAQSCLTLSNPMDCSLPGSSVHGIFQARVLEWGAVTFSRNGTNSHQFTLLTRGNDVNKAILNKNIMCENAYNL